MRAELETETGIGSPIRGIARERSQSNVRACRRQGPPEAGAQRSGRPSRILAACGAPPSLARAHGRRLRTSDEARMTPFPARALRRACVPGAAFLCLLALPARGQAPAAAPADLAASRERLATEAYVTPAPEIVKLVTAPRQQNAPLTRESPDRRYYLREVSDGMPTVQKFGKFHYYFAGLQVDPAANRARALTTRGLTGLSIVDARTGTARDVEIPAGATASAPAWSPDGKQLAFIASFETASQVYVADAATGRSRMVTQPRTPLLATLVTSVDWTADGHAIVAVLVTQPRTPLLATLVTSVDWTADGHAIVAVLVTQPRTPLLATLVTSVDWTAD